MARIAAVVAADGLVPMEREARAALERGADLVELRLDALRDLSLSGIRRLASAVGPRAIATLRSRAQGGRDDRTGSERAALLEELLRHRFAYVDLELETDRRSIESLRKRASGNAAAVLVSHHFLEVVDVARAAEALDACSASGDVAKVALPVADVETAVQLVELARSRAAKGRRFVLIGMGGLGMMTRALAEDAGQELQYAPLGKAVAPGQLSLRTAIRLRKPRPFLVGLAGHPLGHSISPAIHEAAFAAAGLPGAYLPFDVDETSLDTLLQVSDRIRLRGFNVTIPYKETIVEKLDELDADAERLDAANTVVLQDGWSKGHNTDVYGFRVSLRALGLRLGGRRALVVGAGGAARAVAYVLLREGADVHVTNRTTSRADALADALDDEVEVVPMEALSPKGPWDLLVNATPAGTKGTSAELPVPESVVAGASFVYDLVYNPPSTPLLEAARRHGRRGTSGLEMLLHQAAKSFGLWTQRDAPFEAMRRAAKEALS